MSNVPPNQLPPAGGYEQQPGGYGPPATPSRTPPGFAVLPATN